jgi:hypothetical protein
MMPRSFCSASCNASGESPYDEVRMPSLNSTLFRRKTKAGAAEAIHDPAHGA